MPISVYRDGHFFHHFEVKFAKILARLGRDTVKNMVHMKKAEFPIPFLWITAKNLCETILSNIAAFPQLHGWIIYSKCSCSLLVFFVHFVR